jgi:hypothetical protein
MERNEGKSEIEYFRPVFTVRITCAGLQLDDLGWLHRGMGYGGGEYRPHPAR